MPPLRHGGVAIGFMTWMWLSATIIMVGAERDTRIETQARFGAKPGESKPKKK